MAYTVSKLTDYSAAALVNAAAECIRACAGEAGAVRNDADLKALRDRWMGRKNGILTQINELWLKGAPKDGKREAGIRVNELKARIQELVEGAHVASTDAGFTAAERVDITLPGVRRPLGAEHPVIRTTNEMVRVFQKLGYSVADGPVVETDYYNFEALNFPPNIRRGIRRILCSSRGSRGRRSGSGYCCGRILLRCRFGLWRRCGHRFAL